MGLECGCDGDYYVDCDPDDNTAIAANTILCRECNHLIRPGEEYYRVREWKIGDWDPDTPTPWVEGKEVEVGVREICDGCGGVAYTILMLGYCYNFGSLRADVREMAAIQREIAEDHRKWKERKANEKKNQMA